MNFKRLLSLVLSFCMVFTLFSGVPFAVNADSYYDKYGITYEELFTKYPGFLSPEVENHDISYMKEGYTDVLNSYSGTDEWIASYMYSLKNGIPILTNEFLSLLGLGMSTKEKMMLNSSQLLMENINSYDKAVSPIAEVLAADFAVLNEDYDLSTATGQEYFVNKAAQVFKSLPKKEILKVVETCLDESKSLMKFINAEIKFAQVVVGILELNEIETSMIQSLVDSLSSIWAL